MSQKGFTLTELLVVMAITGILAGAVLVNYRGASRNYALDQGIQQLISDLRRAQNMSMSGVSIDDVTGYCGYGLVINSGSPASYILYVDKKPGGSPCGSSNNKYAGEEDDIIETISLPDGVAIDPVTPALDILFKYPEPTAYINQVSNPGTSGTVTLRNEISTRIKSISVNAAGLIQRD